MRQILKEDVFGDAVLSNYDRSGKVEPRGRQTLAGVVGKELLKLSRQ